MTQDELDALPDEIRFGPGHARREPVGVVELTGTYAADGPTLVRLECAPAALRRCHLWLDAVAERNHWGGKVRSWEERR